MSQLAEFQSRTEALAYLYGRLNYESRPPVPSARTPFKLRRMRQLLELLGDPHHDLDIVHVGGSKGKGSVATMLAAAFDAAGLRSGLYTSPHLKQIEERFAVGGRPCSAQELVALVNTVRSAAEQLDRQTDDEHDRSTFFELTTAMAFVHFRAKNVRAVILEVGLGGRLDSTNVCRPRVSVITSISRDHVQQLGETTAEIAREKAGIIKPGVPAVTGVTDPDARHVLREKARAAGAAWVAIDEQFHVDAVQVRATGTRCRYRSEDRTQPLELAMVGAHQARNAAVALATLEQWSRNVEPIDWNRAVRGLEQARNRARIEVVRQQPCVILDAAHNPASIEALLETVNQIARPRRKIVLFATAADKEIEPMLDALLRDADQVVLTEFRQPARACPVARLESHAADWRRKHPDRAISVVVEPDAAEAWRRARDHAAPDDAIIITGSFFLAGQLADLID